MDEAELYGVAREQFIAERNAWAKALRAEGRREEATRVGALRKPSAAASVVNHLVRAEPDRFTALLEAGDRLRAAQDRMLSGDGTADELRDAVGDERTAVDELLATASAVGGAVSDRVAATLHAAALDDDARGRVRGGQLVQELAHVGFGAGSAAAAPPPRRQAGRAREPERELEQAEQRRQAEQRTLARHAERDARHRVEVAQRALANAEHHHTTALSALRDAERKLAGARDEADVAAVEHDAAQAALKALPSGPARR